MSVSALEQQKSDARTAIERGKMARRLHNNRDFRKLILEEFCTTECARFAQLSADPLLKPEDRADALALAQAAGHLKRYLSMTVRMGDTMESQLTELDEAIAEEREREAVESEMTAEDDDGYEIEGVPA